MKMLALLGIFIFSFSALAMNGRTTYQARIVKPDGYPLEAVSVTFKFSILDTVGSCILYSETYSAINMTATGGLISFALGGGARSFPPASATTAVFSNVFDNSITSMPCEAAGIYNPLPNDTRRIVMQFNDGNGWQTLPAMTINAVPYAMYAAKSNDSKTLNGKADTAFVETSTLAALNCTATQAIKFNNATFSCIEVPASGSGGITSVTTSGSVLSTGGTASAPVISIQVATLSQDGYLSSVDWATFNNKQQATSAAIIATLGYTPADNAASGTYAQKANNLSDLTNIPQARTNLGLGSFATASTIDLGSASATGSLDIARLPSFVGDATVAAASNTIILSNSGVTAGTYTKVTVDSKGRVTSSSSLSSNDVTTALGYTPATSTTLAASFVQKTGDTMTGLLNLPSNGLAVGTSQLVVSGSNVGIGVLNPTAALNLKVGTTTNAPLKFTSGTLLSSAQSGTIEYDGSQLYFTDGSNTRRALATNSSPGSFDNTSSISNTSGNITLSPNNITGSVIVNSSAASISSGTGALVVNGGVGVGGSINAGGNLGVTGSATIGQSLTLSSMTSGSLLFAGTGGVVSENNSKLFWDGANQRLGLGTNSPAQTLSVSGSSYFSGNVGIGTSAPTAKLDIDGGSGKGRMFFDVSGSNPAIVLAGDATTGYYPGIDFRPLGNSALGGSIMSYSSTGGMLLIGRAGPVEMRSDSATNTVLSVRGAASQTGNLFEVRTFASGGGDLLTVNSTGNVGIGTTAPTYKLDVSGGGIKLDGRSALTDNAYFVGSPTFGFRWNSSNDAFNNVIMYDNGNMYVRGNVGIGTGAPTTKLDVAGNIFSNQNDIIYRKATSGSGSTATELIALSNFGIISHNDNTVAADTSTISSFAASRTTTTVSIRNAGTGAALTVPAGNVGIGTTAPTRKLTVSSANASYNQVSSDTWSGISVYNPNAGAGYAAGIRFSVGAYDGDQRGSGIAAIANGTEYASDLAFITALGGATSSEKMRITSTGNVGVGTTAPTEKLQVAGNILIPSGNYIKGSNVGGGLGPNIRLGNGTNETIQMNGSYVDLQSQTGFNFQNSNGTRMVMDGSGNVGIGTTTPGLPLEVAVTGDNWASRVRAIGIGYTDHSWHSLQAYNNSSVASSFLINPIGGNVGIGTTTPSAKLHLAAGISSTAPLKFTSGTLLSSPQSGTMEYDGTNFYLTDSTNTRRAIATGLNAGSIDNTSNVNNSSGNISMTPNGSVIVSATTASTSSNTGALIVKGGLGVAGNIYSSGTIVTSSNVGIGTNNPISSLQISNTGSYTAVPWGSPGAANENQIYGALTVGDRGTGGSLAIRTASANSTYPSGLGIDGSYAGAIATINLKAFGPQAGGSYGSNLTFSTTSGTVMTEAMRIDRQGYIGIGTTAPTGRLQIQASNGNLGFRFNDSSIDLGGGTGVQTGTISTGSANSSVVIQNSGTYTPLMVAANPTIEADPTKTVFRVTDNTWSTPWLAVVGGGNVGIGTSSPTHKLDIMGDNNQIRLSTNGAYASIYPYHSGVNTGAMYWSSTGDAVLEGRTAAGRIIFGTGGTSVERMRIDSSGNVGVGTTTPSTKLDIVGAATISNPSGNNYNENLRLPPSLANDYASIALGSSSTATSGTSAGQWTFVRFPTAVHNNLFTIRNNSTDHFAITASGNVGIGVTTPNTSLSFGDTHSNAVGCADEPHGYIHGAGCRNDVISVYEGGPQDKYGLGIHNSTLEVYSAGHVEIGRRNTDGTGAFTPTVHVNVNGNVGIGTTSPSNKLDVSGTTRLGAGVDYGTTSVLSVAPGDVNFDAPGVPSGRLKISGSTGNVGIGTTTPDGKLNIAGTTSNWTSNGWYKGLRLDTINAIELGGGATTRYGIGSSSNILYFFDTTVEDNSAPANYRMVINSGNVGIGTTAPSYTLHVVGTAGLSTGTAWTNASDIRLKDIQGDYEYGLNEILKLHTVRYNYKKGNALGLPSDFSKTGFIAQEVQKVIPDAVNVRKDGYLELNVDPIHWAVVNAIKDLYKLVMEQLKGYDRQIASIVESKADKAEIEVLKQKAAEVDVLKAENVELKNKAKEFDALKSYLCSKDPAAPICK